MENKKEKLCAFYASDYHFEMISLPYIDKEIKNKNQVVILTENDLKETIQKVLSRTNLKEEEKKKIYEIGWEKSNQEKIETLKIPNNLKTTIFIKGSIQYIQETANKLATDSKDNIQMIHCYSIEETNEKTNQIIEQYDGILKTTGKNDTKI